MGHIYTDTQPQGEALKHFEQAMMELPLATTAPRSVIQETAARLLKFLPGNAVTSDEGSHNGAEDLSRETRCVRPGQPLGESEENVRGEIPGGVASEIDAHDTDDLRGDQRALRLIRPASAESHFQENSEIDDAAHDAVSPDAKEEKSRPRLENNALGPAGEPVLDPIERTLRRRLEASRERRRAAALSPGNDEDFATWQREVTREDKLKHALLRHLTASPDWRLAVK